MYGQYRAITIDHTKCGSSDSSNFPVAVIGTYAYLATVANSGKVTSGSGYDIQFFSDVGLTTALNFERVSYNATTGAIEFWVNVPTVSHTTDTVIYMAYGNSTVTTDQQNQNATWNTNYKGVWHLQEDPSGTAPQMIDSTATPLNATSHGSMVSGDLVAAAAGKGLQFEKANAEYLTASYNAKIDITGDLTVEGWVKLTTLTSGQDAAILAHGDGAVYWQYLLYGNASTSKFTFVNSNGGSVAAAATLSTGTQYYVVGVKSGTSGLLYINGLQSNTATGFGNPTARSEGVTMANNVFAPSQQYLDGILDELRISNAARSADWILTGYNNISSPSTFYTVGSEIAISSGDSGDFFMSLLGVG